MDKVSMYLENGIFQKKTTHIRDIFAKLSDFVQVN